MLKTFGKEINLDKSRRLSISYRTMIRKAFPFLAIILLAGVQTRAQELQYSAGPFPWNSEPTGVSFENLSLYSLNGQYNLDGDWYHSDNEEGWVTLEKAFTSTEGGSYESWILATFTPDGVSFDIYNGQETPAWKKYTYSGEGYANLNLEGYYEWKIGENGYNDWVSTPPPYPVVESLNLGESMTGQGYITSYIPEADFSFVENTSNGAFFSEAKELNLNLEFIDGRWAPKK
jgi:hypothetical protein